MVSTKSLTVSERIAALYEERQQWILKREELLVRKKKLWELLQFQASNAPKERKKDSLKTKNDENGDTGKKNNVMKMNVVLLAQKKELKELQTRAEEAKKKQQMAASILDRNVKQLHAKRKREEKEPVGKQAHVGKASGVKEAAGVYTMHPSATASDLDVATPQLAEATCFRIVTRHLVQTNKMIAKEKLGVAFRMYTGKDMDKVILGRSSVECLFTFQCAQKPRRTVLPSTTIRSVRWQPGRQFLSAPTFVSSDANRLQLLIQVEKEVVAGVCGTRQLSNRAEVKRFELVKRYRQAAFLEHCLDDGAAIPTLSAFLCARVGIQNQAQSTAGTPFRILIRSYGQVTGVFETMEKWLCEQGKPIDSQSDTSLLRLGNPDIGTGPRVFSRKRARPFSVANESIVKQLRSATTSNATTSTKIDPMKMLCYFELNGACNDQNCSNYHRKDYEPIPNDATVYTADDVDVKALKQSETDQLVLSFIEFRKRIMKKWPVITTQTSSAAKSASWDFAVTDAVISDAADAAATVPEKFVVMNEDSLGKDNDEFLSLDVPERLPEIGNARYFNNLDSIEAYGKTLQRSVKERLTDTNAWLLLAIYQLGLDVGRSDEAVNVSDEGRLQEQLVFLSVELNTKLHGGVSRIPSIEEANLKRCLHTLSRALEVEANAYCEALWLLYLHLCRQVTNKQIEIDMAEQAVQFLPSSHALWLHYISTYDFESISMTEGIYWRLLDHLARRNSVGDGPHVLESISTKKLSILLTAICFHLCMKLWGAGATSRVIELLSALLQLGDSSLDFGWCSLVRGALRSKELIVFHLAFAHVLLFKELPEIIEHWVVVSSDASIPVKDMTYSLESFQRGWVDIDIEVCDRVLAAYESALQIFEKECNDEQSVGNAILNNWMLVLSYQDDVSKEDHKTLHVFLEDKLDLIQLYPGASLTAAKLMSLTSADEKQACQVMLTMMNCDSAATYPEALYHYLLGCRQSPSLVDALNKVFPDIMERLANILDIDMNRVKQFIQDIMPDANNVSKSRELKALLDALLAAWIDQLALLRRSNLDPFMNKETRLLANVFVALDICHLMDILLEASVAIAGVQMILSSLSFGALFYEARQLVWIHRFVFQVNLLQEGEADDLSRREHQTILTRLFRKYIAEMNVGAEMIRQVRKHIRYDVARNAVDSAVCACLYPERSHILTFGVNLELFQLCSNAVAQSQLTSFYAAFTEAFALSPEFSLSFSNIAFHEWELLAARANLRKCLIGAKTKHSEVLQALVAVEMRLRNMKAVSCLLKSEIEADPLVVEPWRLIVGLEMLFGEMSDVRSKRIAKEIAKRQLVFACNTFGDYLLDQKDMSRIVDGEATSLRLRGLGLTCVPNAVLLKNELVSLDISGNKCIELPMGLRHLQHLQKLNVSENSLIEFPTAVHDLTQLKELMLAHNNMTSFPVMPHLDFLDVSWNAISHLPSPSSLPSTGLGMLRAEKNAMSLDELSKAQIGSLSNGTSGASHSLMSKKKSSEDERAEEQSDNRSMLQTSSVSLSESINVQCVVVPTSAEAEIVTNNLNTGHSTTAKEDDDDDQIMEQRDAGVAHKSEGHVDDQMKVTDLESHPRADERGQVTMPENADILPASKENKSSRLDKDSRDDSATNELSVASEVVEPAKKVIEVDDSELSDENDEDTVVPGGQSVSISSNIGSSTDTPDNVIAFNDPTMASIVEVRDVVAATTGLHQSSHEGALVALKRLTTYMESSHINSRAEVRERNPTLWREFLAANLQVNVQLPACRLCFASNDGHNQRFNSMVLCVRCLEDALFVLKKRRENGQVAEAQEDASVH